MLRAPRAATGTDGTNGRTDPLELRPAGAPLPPVPTGPTVRDGATVRLPDPGCRLPGRATEAFATQAGLAYSVDGVPSVRAKKNSTVKDGTN